MPRPRRLRTHRHPPRWRRRPEARPEELLDAALAVFAEQGFARARLEEVARRAGVSKGTVYLYFESKEALFREMVRAKVGSAITAGEHFVRAFHGPTHELLITFVHRYWAVMLQPTNARLTRLVFSELGNFPELTRFYMEEVVLRVRRVIIAIIERGVARGEFRSVSPTLAARALQGLCVHLAQCQRALLAYEDAPLTDEQVIAGIIDLSLHGLLAKPEAAPTVG
jgi:AcrR family transcriptional regulator